MLTYNVPTLFLDAYEDTKLIVRSDDVNRLVASLSNAHADRIVTIQARSLAADPEALLKAPRTVPVDVVVGEPGAEYENIYRYSEVARKHPVRVSVRVFPGFGKVVKLAASLNFPVKLEIGELDRDLAAEIVESLDYYLHSSTLGQPIEFFHSVLLGFYHNHPLTLWQVMEEDPAELRFVTDEGKLVLSERLAAVEPGADPSTYIDELRGELLAEKGECSLCRFFKNCGGYFRAADRKFRCDDVKRIFQTLRNAAKELKHDYAQLVTSEERPRA